MSRLLLDSHCWPDILLEGLVIISNLKKIVSKKCKTDTLLCIASNDDGGRSGGGGNH